jgi:hypothetical protein
VKVLDSDKPVTDSVPDAARAPDQPPDALHADAFDADQFKVTVPPGDTLPGVALIDTTGLAPFLDFSTPTGAATLPAAQAVPVANIAAAATAENKLIFLASAVAMTISPVPTLCSSRAEAHEGLRNQPLH